MPNATSFIITGLILIIIIILSFYINEIKSYHTLKKEYDMLKIEINDKYINTKDVRLLNAAQKAYEDADKEKNDFEIKEYKALVEELRRKW